MKFDKHNLHINYRFSPRPHIHTKHKQIEITYLLKENFKVKVKSALAEFPQMFYDSFLFVFIKYRFHKLCIICHPLLGKLNTWNLISKKKKQIEIGIV